MQSTVFVALALCLLMMAPFIRARAQLCRVSSQGGARPHPDRVVRKPY